MRTTSEKFAASFS